MRRMVLLAVAVACAFPAAALADTPPGATAVCKDGTYSFSQTHSGTCSYHGGVAQWLDSGAPVPATTVPPPVTSTPVKTTAPAATPTTVTTTSPGSTSPPAVPGASAVPPAGATARCGDATFSFSQHRAGTCSGHGGVANWLNGGPAGTSTPTVSGAGRAVASALGVTVLLAQRTQSSGCKVAANPDRRCSPGAYYSSLTKTVICSPGFRTSTIRNVPQSEKSAVERAYGLTATSYGRTLEIDHIISLELGGSNEIANLYPEKIDARPGYRVKDKLENNLHALVCSGQISLRSAQRQIASDWQALYKQVYGQPPVG
jgi:hypothetical protein